MVDENNRASTLNNGLLHEEEPVYTGTATLAAIGFGIYLAWTIGRIVPTLFPDPLPQALPVIVALDIPHSLAYIVILVLFGFIIFHRCSLKQRRFLALCIAGIVAFGSGLQYLSGWFEPLGASALSAGIFLSAFEMGLFLLWGEVFTRFSLRRCCVMTALSYALGFFLCMTLVQLAPAWCLGIHTLLPLFSGFMLWVCQGELSDQQIRPAHHLTFKSLPPRFFVGFAFLACMLLLTSDLSEHMTSNATEFQSILTGCITSVVILAVAYFMPTKLDFGVVYRFFVPAIIVCLVFVLIADPASPPWEISAVGICWTTFRITTWVMLCVLTRRLGVAAFAVFAAGQVALALGGIAEKIIKPVIDVLNDPVFTLVPIIMLMAVVTSTILLNERHIMEIFDLPRGRQPLMDQSDMLQIRVDQLARSVALSEREQEVALLIGQGLDNDDIEERLSIAPSTLKTHIRNIYAKCDVHSRKNLMELLKQPVSDESVESVVQDQV